MKDPNFIVEVYYDFTMIEGSNHIINSSNSSLLNHLANTTSTKDLSTASNTNSNVNSNASSKKDKKKNDKSKSDNKDK